MRRVAGSDTDKALMESKQAENVREYLEGRFATLAVAEATLLGEGANFTELTARERDDLKSVFAWAPRPSYWVHTSPSPVRARL